MYESQAIGAYLLTQPGGEVTGLSKPAAAMDEMDAMAEETEAASLVETGEGAWPTE